MEGKLVLQILILTCLCRNSLARSSSHDGFQSLLRNVADDPMLRASPNSHISGPNGYCIDVYDKIYLDGNSIILWPCQPDQANQIWTFESDGTLRSNGKCLATGGYRQGSKIMIYGCSSAAKEATIWELKSDGVIVNPKSQLVLTAMPGTAGTTLTVQTDISSSYQTWRVNNDTQPSLVKIIGMNNLCLQATDGAVWIEGCQSSNTRQQWLLYPDGTVRPKENPEWCLSYVSLPNRKVLALTCGLGTSSQRWLFTTSGTILNERVNLVVDVRLSDPSLKQIIVWTAVGTANQKWKVLPM